MCPYLGSLLREGTLNDFFYGTALLEYLNVLQQCTGSCKKVCLRCAHVQIKL